MLSLRYGASSQEDSRRNLHSHLPSQGLVLFQLKLPNLRRELHHRNPAYFLPSTVSSDPHRSRSRNPIKNPPDFNRLDCRHLFPRRRLPRRLLLRHLRRILQKAEEFSRTRGRKHTWRFSGWGTRAYGGPPHMVYSNHGSSTIGDHCDYDLYIQERWGLDRWNRVLCLSEWVRGRRESQAFA